MGGYFSKYKGIEVDSAIKSVKEIIPKEIESIKNSVNDLAKQKADTKSVPKKVSQLENDANFITKDDVPELNGGSGDLSDYVKNTDYATTDKAGVVKLSVSTLESAVLVDDNGYIRVVPAEKFDIDERTTNLPITPRTIDYAVKSVGDGYYATAEELGDISTALDSILAIQETIVGGVN